MGSESREKESECIDMQPRRESARRPEEDPAADEREGGDGAARVRDDADAEEVHRSGMVR